nr:sorting and assembly machinery component 50 homolog B-like [Ipomoea batatas]
MSVRVHNVLINITLDAGPPELPGTANVIVEVIEAENPITGSLLCDLERLAFLHSNSVIRGLMASLTAVSLAMRLAVSLAMRLAVREVLET